MEPHFDLTRNPGSEESTNGEDHSKILCAVQCMCEEGWSLTRHRALARSIVKTPSLQSSRRAAHAFHCKPASGSGSGEHPYLFVDPKNSSSASEHFPSCKLLNTRGSVLEPQLLGGGFFP